jgi:hypothetical protein
MQSCRSTPHSHGCEDLKSNIILLSVSMVKQYRITMVMMTVDTNEAPLCKMASVDNTIHITGRSVRTAAQE